MSPSTRRGSNQYVVRGSPPARRRDGTLARLYTRVRTDGTLLPIDEDRIRLEDRIDAGQPVTAAEWEDAVYSDVHSIREAAARRPDCPPHLLAVVACTDHPADGFGVARSTSLLNPACPRECAEEVVRSADDAGVVRSALSVLDGVPVSAIRDRLASVEPNQQINFIFAALDLPDDVMVTLAHQAPIDSGDQVLTRVATAADPPRPDSRALLTSVYEHLLANDAPLSHRAYVALARNPGTSPQVLYELACQGGYPTTVGAVAKNPSSPTSAILACACRGHRDALDFVEQMESVPASALDIISKHVQASRRAAVAARADCPDLVFDRLSSDPIAFVRQAVADNPKCPEHVRAAVAFL